jgi:hypothetical protein
MPMKKLLAITAAVVTSAGVTLLAVWPDSSTTSAHALTVERAVAASVPVWPAPGMCVLMESTVEEDDAGLRQRPWEICHRVGYPESDDPRAYYATRVEVECRQAAREMCGLNVDAGVPLDDAGQPDEKLAQQLRVAAQKCSLSAQDDCARAAQRIGVSPGWMSEPYPWTTQPAIRKVNRPGAIWRAHGCVCRATAGGACRYWPGRGEDAGVTVPTGMVVPAAKAIIGAGCVDTPCVETQAREQIPGCDWRTRNCTLAEACQP